MLLQQRRKIVAPFAILGTIATYCIKSTFSNYTPATAFVVPFSLRRFYLSSSSSSSSSSSHVSSIRSIIVPRNVLFMSSTNDDIAASPNGEEEHSQFDWINDKEQWKTKKTPKDFSILSWNILSQNASTVIKNETYSYKGIDIPPPKPWEYRMPQITQKIHDINADLCCLQEMDITSFESMEPIMKKMGYEGVLQKKRIKSSSCCHLLETRSFSNFSVIESTFTYSLCIVARYIVPQLIIGSCCNQCAFRRSST
mmetsp:Transcript_38336/g.56001  ORF Transcript_38336/g.56001 Transcript_38336/m.56001 type:complete len:254 (+) Transcript_38336:76-837(+)